MKYDTCNTENSPLNADFKGLFIGIMKRGGGAVNLEMAKPGAVFCQKKGGCSFAVGTQTQRVSAPLGDAHHHLLRSGSEQHEVLLFESI